MPARPRVIGYKKGTYMKKIAVLLIISSILISCGLFSTPIKKIVENPRDYDGKTVTISGEVRETFSLFVVRYFIIADRTGEITVITSRPLPKEGSNIRVKGVVNEAFSLGQSQSVVIVEEEKPK
jgi:hypothetical protein